MRVSRRLVPLVSAISLMTATSEALADHPDNENIELSAAFDSDPGPNIAAIQNDYHTNLTHDLNDVLVAHFTGSSPGMWGGYVFTCVTCTSQWSQGSTWEQEPNYQGCFEDHCHWWEFFWCDEYEEVLECLSG
jgi:hypothetical protein